MYVFSLWLLIRLHQNLGELLYVPLLGLYGLPSVILMQNKNLKGITGSGDGTWEGEVVAEWAIGEGGGGQWGMILAVLPF